MSDCVERRQGSWVAVPAAETQALEAALLLAWLACWLLAELAGLGALAFLSRSFRGGLRLGNGAPWFGVTVWSCLLLWLLHWTARGAFTLRELISVVAGEDRIRVSGGAMSIESRLGPFVRARSLDLDEVLDVELNEEGALIARTRGAPLLLTNYGTRVGRSRLRDDLRQALGRSQQGG
jgi:hypothetical protein